ncbi:26S proteasome non-ATPase regulatory subunit 9-like [Oopsacas minuta]|uniref:26S proteasome non-ATPase regulatory subunit 9-like n=1 Tax=Oopsacas minuta TaxID=111878 RepID=A0AAV7JTU6_9METZ|nr:26S proteasome non-ATPase regulatory subunit 9-like [Oopsacas minuta]
MAEIEVLESGFENLSATELMSKKSGIEGEIHELLQGLDAQGGVGMKGSLIDSEKFPRNDIDLYAVRSARQRVIRLRNDHKSVMKEIENKLHELHAESKLNKLLQTDTQTITRDTGGNKEILEKTFARISMVSYGSPADKAELKNGDLLIEFGSVNITNFSGIGDIGRVVQHSEGARVSVQVLRGEKRVGLSLEPKRWSGRGLLGCMVNPI